MIALFDRERIRRRLIALRENTLMALETLRQSKMRSFLTILGVLIGVVIVTSIASVLNGFRVSVVEQVEAFGTNVIYVTRFPVAMHGGPPDRRMRTRKAITLADAWAIRDHCPSVAAVSPATEYPSFLTTARAGALSMDGPLFRGVFPDMDRVLSVNIREGRFFTESENAARLDVAVIANDVAQALFPKKSRITGEEIEVVGRRYRVIGVLEKYPQGPVEGANREDKVIMVPYWTLMKRMPSAEDHFVAIESKPQMIAAAQEEIIDVLRRHRKVRWDQDNDFEVNTAESIIRTFDQIIYGAMAVMFILSSVAFLVGGVGVMNIMLASVKERTSEIGMRKAIGARRRDIAWQFLIEAMVLTGLGGLLGMLLTDALRESIRLFWPTLPISTPLWARIAGITGSVTVGLIFGIVPALKAARLDPIVSLRHE